MTSKLNYIFHNDSFVCYNAILLGVNITVGANTIIHPKAVIDARLGSIVIGNDNIIEENAIIRHTGIDPDTPMVIGNFNVFEVGSILECSKIGNENVVEIGATCECSSVIGDKCIIGTKCTVAAGDVLCDETIVYGSTSQRRLGTEVPVGIHKTVHPRHILLLKKLLSQSHRKYAVSE